MHSLHMSCNDDTGHLPSLSLTLHRIAWEQRVDEGGRERIRGSGGGSPVQGRTD